MDWDWSGINYDEYELFELFESEPIISTVEEGFFVYRKNFNSGIKILLSLWSYEKKCEIFISINENILFETTLRNVEYMRSDGKCLRIHQKDADIDYLIYFYPNFFVKTEDVPTDQLKRRIERTYDWSGIKYDEHELFELFESDPMIPTIAADGFFSYSKKFNNGINIYLNLWTYEKKCGIFIDINENILFETTLKNVEYMRSDGKRLRIHQKDSDIDYLIYFYPNFFVKTEDVPTDKLR